MDRFRNGCDTPPAYFYCSRSNAEPKRSDPAAILASIASQMSFLHPGDPLLSPAVELYKKKEAEGFKSGPLRIDECCALILQLTEYYQMTVIVLDALDECNPDLRDELLEALGQIIQDSPNLVKIFVSSRDEQDIVFYLQTYPNLKISSDRNSEDIVTFVKMETGRLIKKKKLLRYSQDKTKMEEIILDAVIKGAGGM